MTDKEHVKRVILPLNWEKGWIQNGINADLNGLYDINNMVYDGDQLKRRKGSKKLNKPGTLHKWLFLKQMTVSDVHILVGVSASDLKLRGYMEHHPEVEFFVCESDSRQTISFDSRNINPTLAFFHVETETEHFLISSVGEIRTIKKRGSFQYQKEISGKVYFPSIYVDSEIGTNYPADLPVYFQEYRNDNTKPVQGTVVAASINGRGAISDVNKMGVMVDGKQGIYSNVPFVPVDTKEVSGNINIASVTGVFLCRGYERFRNSTPPGTVPNGTNFTTVPPINSFNTDGQITHYVTGTTLISNSNLPLGMNTPLTAGLSPRIDYAISSLPLNWERSTNGLGVFRMRVPAVSYSEPDFTLVADETAEVRNPILVLPPSPLSFSSHVHQREILGAVGSKITADHIMDENERGLGVTVTLFRAQGSSVQHREAYFAHVENPIYPCTDAHWNNDAYANENYFRQGLFYKNTLVGTDIASNYTLHHRNPITLAQLQALGDEVSSGQRYLQALAQTDNATHGNENPSLALHNGGSVIRLEENGEYSVLGGDYFQVLKGGNAASASCFDSGRVFSGERAGPISPTSYFKVKNSFRGVFVSDAYCLTDGTNSFAAWKRLDGSVWHFAGHLQEVTINRSLRKAFEGAPWFNVRIGDENMEISEFLDINGNPVDPPVPNVHNAFQTRIHSRIVQAIRFVVPIRQITSVNITGNMTFNQLEARPVRPAFAGNLPTVGADTTFVVAKDKGYNTWDAEIVQNVQTRLDKFEMNFRKQLALLPGGAKIRALISLGDYYRGVRTPFAVVLKETGEILGRAQRFFANTHLLPIYNGFPKNIGYFPLISPAFREFNPSIGEEGYKSILMGQGITAVASGANRILVATRTGLFETDRDFRISSEILGVNETVLAIYAMSRFMVCITPTRVLAVDEAKNISVVRRIPESICISECMSGCAAVSANTVYYIFPEFTEGEVIIRAQEIKMLIKDVVFDARSVCVGDASRLCIGSRNTIYEYLEGKWTKHEMPKKWQIDKLSIFNNELVVSMYDFDNVDVSRIFTPTRETEIETQG